MRVNVSYCPSMGPGPDFHTRVNIPVSLLADSAGLTLMTVLAQTRLKTGVDLPPCYSVSLLDVVPYVPNS